MDNMFLTSQFLGAHMHKSLKKAAGMAQKHREIFDKFSSTFPPEVVSDWTRIVEAWNVDPSGVPDPYEEPIASESCMHTRYHSII